MKYFKFFATDAAKSIVLLSVFSTLIFGQNTVKEPLNTIANTDLVYYTDAIFSNNGQNIFAAASDNTLCVFNNNGQRLRVFKAHQKPIRNIATSIDATLLSVSEDKSIKFWTPEGDLLYTIEAHNRPVTSITVSKSGNYVVSTSEDKTSKVWDKTGKLLQTLKGHTDVVNAAAFSADENFIVTASNDNSVKLWTSKGEMLRTFSKFDGHVRSIAFSPDSRQFLVAVANEAYLLTHTGKQLVVFADHTARVNKAVFSPDGKYVLTASNDKTAKLWDINGNLIYTFIGHNSSVNSVAFSSDGSKIVTTSLDNTINIYSLQPEATIVNVSETRNSNKQAVYAVPAVSPKEATQPAKVVQNVYPKPTSVPKLNPSLENHSTNLVSEATVIAAPSMQKTADVPPVKPMPLPSKSVKMYDGPLFSSYDFNAINEAVQKPKVFAVVVGIASYNHVQSLKFTKDDAYLMYAFLKSPEGGAIPDDQITLLIDGNATKDRIMQSLQKTFSQAGTNDAILFYYAGHGLSTGILPIDYDGFNNIIPYGDIYSVFENNTAKYKFCITDACYAGNFSQYASRGDGFDEVQTVVNNYYNAIKKTAGGTAILMSSKAQEKSVEYLGLRQGVFSHFLIRGLKGEADEDKDKLITILELYNYVEKEVRTYTGNNQSPSLFGNFDINMPVGGVR